MKVVINGWTERQIGGQTYGMVGRKIDGLDDLIYSILVCMDGYRQTDSNRLMG
jgi:hypothetical protein